MKHANEIVMAAGMSARPEYYSGRGATTSDLNERILEKVHALITQEHGAEAAKNFVQMVEDIPKLSATDFLLSLFRLEGSAWLWTFDLLGAERGIYATDEATGMGTILSAMSGMGDRDETQYIKGHFIREHRKELRADQKNRPAERIDRFGYSRQ